MSTTPSSSSPSSPSPKLLPCPCCEAKVISEPGDYEICPRCGWEDDPTQSDDPNFAGGANEPSLNEARKAWAAKKRRERKKGRR